jgi:prepilin-type processing-associated H-X9-DG protein
VKERFRNFTPSDALFAIVAVTILCGIATTSIRKSREAASRAGCENNLRTIGTGSAGFSDAHDQMLPYNQLSAPHGSWNTQILPYIGEEKLAREYNLSHDWWASAGSPNRAVAKTPVKTFECPSTMHPGREVLTIDPDNEGQSFIAAPTDYVGSAGAYLQDNQQENLIPGAMHHRTLVKRLRLPDIVDGTSQTLLVVEMADKPNSWRAGKLFEKKLDKPQSPSLNGQWAAPNWNHLRSYSTDGTTAFGPCAVNCSNGASLYGFHEEGANVLFVDGSVRMLKAGMSQELLIALVSYDKGELLSPEDYALLPSEPK